MANQPVFLDANVLIYALDTTSKPYAETVAQIQHLLDENTQLCTSHHVIEEVLHIVQKLKPAGVTLSRVVDEIAEIPNLVLIEPWAEISFAKRYATLSEKLSMGVNDALLLQLMIDSGLSRLYSYDAKFLNKASRVGIEAI
jgi:predicted nucleic acid-binding protein